MKQSRLFKFHFIDVIFKGGVYVDFSPLKFAPVYHTKIWGGRNLKKVFRRTLPDGQIGESWDVSTHKHGMSIVIEPKHLAGYSLEKLCQLFPNEILSSNNPDFPLLVKLIDANETLSVQVHPDNDYAFIHENGEQGKHELWYVLAAKPDAEIIYGLKPGTTKAQFSFALKQGTITDYLNRLSVKAGDCFYIPAGLIHALGSDILVAEIQQNSDIVYRVYDWDRVDDQGNSRPLHIQHALEVIDFDFQPKALMTKKSSNIDEVLIKSQFFTVEKLIIKKEKLIKTNGFEIITNLNQSINVVYGSNSINLLPGDSCLIPACCSQYNLVTTELNSEILRTYL